MEPDLHVPQVEESALQAKWLDRVWHYLFAGSSAGLMSPGQIRREHRDRVQVRRAELAGIREAEKELHQLQDGSKILDPTGKLVDAPQVDNVETHSIIETPAFDSDAYTAELEAPESMLQSVVQELSVRDMERSLNTRKIALLAEGEVLRATERPVSNQALASDWVRRWRESAQDAFDPALQRLWARALVLEVARPGAVPIATLETLRSFDPADVEVARMAARYSLGPVIFDASGRYFDRVVHGPLFQSAEELGLISGVEAGERQLLRAAREGGSELTLVSYRRALRLRDLEPGARYPLPVYRVTRAGRQIFSLCGGEADMAYLFSLATYLKELGLTVTLGDWDPTLPASSRFIEKMTL